MRARFRGLLLPKRTKRQQQDAKRYKENPDRNWQRGLGAHRLSALPASALISKVAFVTSQSASGLSDGYRFNDVAANDGVDHFHSGDDLAKNGVTAVEMRLRRMCDEPLRAASVFSR